MSTKATTSYFDFSTEQKNVQYVRMQLYNADTYVAGSINAIPIADWVAGDFEQITINSKVQKRKAIDNVVSISFAEKKLHDSLLAEVKKYALKRLTVVVTDSCNDNLVFPTMRLSEGSGVFQEASVFSPYKLDFIRISKKIKSTLIIQDKISSVSVSCEIPLDGNTGNIVDNPNAAIRIVTVVECTI